MNEALMRLAVAAGIENGYWDGLGVRRDLQEPTAAALLAALDFDPLSDTGGVDAQCDALNNAAFLQPLPPAVVLPLEAILMLVVALPLQQYDDAIAWELVLESGDRLSGQFVASQLERIEEREIDGRRYGRFNLPLPTAVPLGYHQFRMHALQCVTALIVGPPRCYIPDSLARGGRCWGVAVQLYALRSARNWGIGDFGDLAALATAAGSAGASFIGLNPLHARHLCRPDEASPYAPSSRLFLDPLYIDVEAVADLATCAEARAAIADPEFQAQIAAACNEQLVDYPAVTALKLRILNLLFRNFRLRAQDADDARAVEFRAFIASGGAPLARFAEFEALRLFLQETTGEALAWHQWPQAYRDSAGSGLAHFRAVAAERIEFQLYLQWIAAQQMKAAASAASAAGMPVGLYRDLAVGAAQDSAEVWSDQQLFVQGMSVGAPPDMLNRQGQTWGLPPWNPRLLATQGYAPLSRLLAANMRNAGALRIDHVMALTRLFWIPNGLSGASGGYVRNRFDELATIVALESVRNRCMVIGEDLGSVPEGFRERLHERGFLSYRVMIYERHWDGDGRFRHPEEYPPQSLATVATHDMPTLTEYWQGGDIERRAALGMFPEPQQRDNEWARRHAERDGLLRLLGDMGLSPANPSDAADVVVSLHSAIARTRSMMAVVQLDDLTGESAPVNIPGTHREYPNWRRKLATPMEALFCDKRWAQLSAIMRAAGRDAAQAAMR